MEWVQTYNPVGNAVISTVLAALPIVVLLVMLGVFEIKAQWAALGGLVTALIIAIVVLRMPFTDAIAATGLGAAYGLLPIGWIVLAAVFLYNLTVETGQFEVVKNSVASLSPDRRIQALLIAFSFGAFLEGGAGFGTPVAICAALLMGLGFPPLMAAGLCLIANTAPVAFGAIGTPLLTLGSITDVDPFILGQMAGRQLPFVSLIIPIWLVVTMSGWRGFLGVWQVVLVSGASFAFVQFFWSNFIGPELVDIAGGLISLAVTAAFASVWKPRENWEFPSKRSSSTTSHVEEIGSTRSNRDRLPTGDQPSLYALESMTASTSTTMAEMAIAAPPRRSMRQQIIRAWMPWVILSLFVLAWGIPQSKAFLTGGTPSLMTYLSTGKAGDNNPYLAPAIKVPSLHQRIYRNFPVVAERVDPAQIANPAYKKEHAESAVYTFNWLGATGTGILLAAVVTAAYLQVSPRTFGRVAVRTLIGMRWPLFTIACMLALGYVTRYSGTDAILGLAFTRTGPIYPFFAPFVGWLGVALTGSDTSSNVLFGSLQKITAQQLGLNPILIITANSTGGVMGKMIDAQSIVVSTAATNQVGQEGSILRFVIWHSLALTCIMGAIVLLQAYVFPGIIPG